MSVYVFLGPTMPVADARAILDASYLPPVACGDVAALTTRSSAPAAIGIVDGFFDEKPAVFHKEILHALSRGVRVFGASSMGALRAAELHAYGMEGVGRVFEAYRDGALEDDDEVAVVHGDASAGFAAASDAMVAIREGLARARGDGAISDATHDALVAIAKETFFPERSWRGLLRLGREHGLSNVELEALAAFVERARPDPKREDAEEMLRRMRRELADPTPLVRRPAFDFQATIWWERLCAHVAHADAYGLLPSDELSAAALDRHARVFHDPERALSRGAAFEHLAREAAERMGLEGAAPMDALVRLLGERAAPYVPRELERRGGVASVAASLRRRDAALAGRGLAEATYESAGVDADDALAWYRARTGAHEETFAAIACALGMTERELREEVLRGYLHDVHDGEAAP